LGLSPLAKEPSRLENYLSLAWDGHSKWVFGTPRRRKKPPTLITNLDPKPVVVSRVFRPVRDYEPWKLTNIHVAS
jgi:hypothetical protein